GGKHAHPPRSEGPPTPVPGRPPGPAARKPPPAPPRRFLRGVPAPPRRPKARGGPRSDREGPPPTSSCSAHRACRLPAHTGPSSSPSGTCPPVQGPHPAHFPQRCTSTTGREQIMSKMVILSIREKTMPAPAVPSTRPQGRGSRPRKGGRDLRGFRNGYP